MKLILALTFASATVFGEPDRKFAAPPEEDRWKFLLAVPGWMPALEGDVGINGLVSQVDLDPGDIIRHYDFALSLRAEASKGRFGIMGDVLYTSLSDGIGTNTVVKKIDLQVDQTIAELALRWRLIDSPRGFLDVVGGMRYVNLFQQIATQANAERIDQVSTELVDVVSDRLRNAVANLGLGELVADELATRIEGFDPERPSQLPSGPLAGRIDDRLRTRIQEILQAKRAELETRLQAVQATAGAARVRAQARLDELKEDISDQIANALNSKLATRLARTDDWWDPFIGFRARYNFNDRFYVTARGDVGGFGAGSDFSWEAEGALGFRLSQNVFAEAGYRALGMNYENNGLTYDVIMHGAQVTVGIAF
jgi:hypothetical protein